MKYAIVIPDGCADDPCPALGGRTPLQAARLPNMDRLAQTGLCGLINNVPASLTPASDVATLSLFGYDPLVVYTGRAPLEAAALGVHLGPNDWAIRCNFVHLPDDHMRDFTAGHIASEQGHQLIAALKESLPPVHGGRLELFPGVGYRNLVVFRGDGSRVFAEDLKTQPPHDIPDQPVAGHLPRGSGADLLIQLMDWSKSILRDHPVNRARRASGERDATQIWLWGQGRAPKLDAFLDRYGRRGAITTGVDLVRGVGALLGWDRLEAAGVTDYLDNDYAAQARLAIENLQKYDLIIVHVEAPDEASHSGLADEKVQALERIDAEIVGPLLEALSAQDVWRMLVAPDHRTPLTTRAHSHGAVPFAMAGAGLMSSKTAHYDEFHAKSGTSFDPGWKLMDFFLNGSKSNR